MRETRWLREDWAFHRGDLAPGDAGRASGQSAGFDVGPCNVAFDDSKWRRVRIPHDFVLEGSFQRRDPITGESLVNHGFLPGGVGWYRKWLTVPAEHEGGRLYLLFDGVYRESSVYLNHFFLGRHGSGYTSFYYDITDFVRMGEENLLAVRVDARRHEGWWYEGGGIYRHVRLMRTPAVHFPPWGTLAISESASPGQPAVVLVRNEVWNATPDARAVRVRVFIAKPQRAGVAVREEPAPAGESVSGVVRLGPWERRTIEQRVDVAEPRLWSIEKPTLYDLHSRIEEEGIPIDEAGMPFGIRTVRFDPNDGFFLNEEPTKLQGVCCHQDHGGVGIALPDRLLEYRIQKLKEMGCNAYRCAHHAPAPALLDACDRLGMMVVDETRLTCSCPDCLADLQSIVRRDRNHPSVILWSLGNEETRVQQRPEARRILTTMKAAVREHDPSRPVTLAICMYDGTRSIQDLSTIEPTAAALDVMGFNYAPECWEEFHRRNPDLPVLITEASSSLRTRGARATDPRTCTVFGLNPSDPNPFWGERQWRRAAESRFIAGVFVWTGFDYRGEPTPYGWPATLSQFGLMDACGFPKDSYFFYKAWWQAEPVLHLFAATSDEAEADAERSVFCYTNCDVVELFRGESSLGRRRVEANWFAQWDGVTGTDRELWVEGFSCGRSCCTHTLSPAGPPIRLALLPDRSEILAHGQDLSVVTVRVCDAAGRTVPTAEHRVAFHLDGPGRLLGLANGDPACHDSDIGTFRRVYRGLCQAIVQSLDRPGTITLRASAEGLDPGMTKIACSQATGDEPCARP